MTIEIVHVMCSVVINSEAKPENCSDPNDESDPSSEYSPLGLTHVMNQYLGQKFTTSVKINSQNCAMESCTVHE